MATSIILIDALEMRLINPAEDVHRIVSAWINGKGQKFVFKAPPSAIPPSPSSPISKPPVTGVADPTKRGGPCLRRSGGSAHGDRGTGIASRGRPSLRGGISVRGQGRGVGLKSVGERPISSPPATPVEKDPPDMSFRPTGSSDYSAPQKPPRPRAPTSFLSPSS